MSEVSRLGPAVAVWLGVLASGCAQPATQVLVWVEVPEGSELRARASSMTPGYFAFRVVAERSLTDRRR